MNWSDYSLLRPCLLSGCRWIEGLLAFFLESTFLGLWIFSWVLAAGESCTRRALCMVHVGTLPSAYFILAANSWMQNPGRVRLQA